MKNLLICLLFLTTGSTSLLSAYEEGTDFSTHAEIHEKTAFPSHDSLEMLPEDLSEKGDPLKAKKISKPKKKVASREICKRPQIKRKNMGNSGAMRNMYSQKTQSLP